MDYQKEIEKRLPKGIEISNNVKLTEDEFVSILCWLKYFNQHYIKFGKEKLPDIISPAISKRMRLDFGLYTTPSTLPNEKGKYLIYVALINTTEVKDIIHMLSL